MIKVYAGIDELIKHTKRHDNIIILGDLNAIVGEDREVRGSWRLRLKKEMQANNE